MKVLELVLHVHETDGTPVISYVDPRENVRYMFGSDRLSVNELLDLVGSSDLIARAQQGR